MVILWPFNYEVDFIGKREVMVEDYTKNWTLRHLGQKESAGIYRSQEIPVVRASSVARDQTYRLAKM